MVQRDRVLQHGKGKKIGESFQRMGVEKERKKFKVERTYMHGCPSEREVLGDVCIKKYFRKKKSGKYCVGENYKGRK